MRYSGFDSAFCYGNSTVTVRVGFDRYAQLCLTGEFGPDLPNIVQEIFMVNNGLCCSHTALYNSLGVLTTTGFYGTFGVFMVFLMETMCRSEGGPMIRFSLLFVSIIALFMSCTSAPDLSRTKTHGSDIHPELSTVSGSAEENGSLNRAAPPAGITRMKTEEARVIVARYEADMDEYLASGNYADAFDSFNKAADILASVKGEPEFASSIRERMYNALKKVRVSPASVPGDTIPGKAFSRNFSIKAVAAREDSVIPLAGVPCTVRYPAYREDESIEEASAELITDDAGVASFTAPVPSAPGKNTVTISADFPLRDAVLAERLRKEDPGAFSVSFVHGVETTRKSIPTTISILDYNKNGNPVLSYSQTATRLLRPLIQKGFSRIGMADFPRQLAAGDEEKLIAAERDRKSVV